MSSQRTALSALPTSSACGASTLATRKRQLSVSTKILVYFVSTCLILSACVIVADFGSDLPPSTEPQTFNYTNVQVSINDAYACTIYTSCKQTSFIAAAGVSSAVGFLNFLGTNGAPYSLSYINFTETAGDDTTGYLDSKAWPCQDAVNDTLWGYTGMENATCSFCAKACPPPVVDDKIGFLDGFSWKIVGYSYLGFVLFTILFQVVTHCWLKKRKLEAARNAAMQN